MSFSSILSNINLTLEFVLSAFSSVITFINSNPILAISVYIPLATILIYAVFGLIGKLLHRKKDVD